MKYLLMEIVNDLETIRLQLDMPRYPSKSKVLRKDLDELIEKYKERTKSA